MKCLPRPVWTDFGKEELRQLSIRPPKEEIRKQILENWDTVAKPIGGMGKFEPLIARIGAIAGTTEPQIEKRAVVVMCADNGIVEEGVSQSGQEVTVAVARLMAEGNSSVGRMAKAGKADLLPVDIGICLEEKIAGIMEKKIRKGTRNFLKEPAMTEQEAIRAIAVGIDLAFTCKEAGYQLLGSGELGMGNTTTASAVTAALLDCEVDRVTGRGAGLTREGLMKKKQVIAEVLESYGLRKADPLTVLQTVGGLDIAGLTGLCLGGALCGLPVVLDGAISMAAALVAERLFPGTKDYLLPSHKGKEPAVELVAKELGLEPVIDGSLALGEGTGAVMLFPLLDLALSIYQNRSTFADIQLEQYERLEE